MKKLLIVVIPIFIFFSISIRSDISPNIYGIPNIHQFHFSIKQDTMDGEIGCYISENDSYIEYKYIKPIIFRGKKIFQKKISIHFTDREIRRLIKYIYIMKIPLINSKKLNAGIYIKENGLYGIRKVAGKEYKTVFHLYYTKNFTEWECSVINLNKWVSIDENINKLWGLEILIETMLNAKRHSLFKEYWIIDDLKNRIKKMNKTKIFEYQNDSLPRPFRFYLRKDKISHLKNLLQALDDNDKKNEKEGH